MGVLNVTPDSFSDGGTFLDPARALAHARDMIEEGADLIDIGAESTRPYGSRQPVSMDEERQRLLPILAPVIALGTPVSIDTLKAEIAAEALRVGAVMVNDVWGLQRDPHMASVVAEHAVPVIVMHNREAADPAIDILEDVKAFLARSIDIALRAGIARERIVIDPGIGFGKTPEQSLQVLARLAELHALGFPLLVGLSRKRFISSVMPSEPQQRLGGSIAGNVMAMLAGASILRVHDVKETVQALRVAAAIKASR
jgi:dihydropteroate synthase